MLQLQCVKIRIVDGKTDRVRSWVASLASRQAEVRAALAAEGIADEAVFFSSESAGDFLYLYSRAPDLASAAAAFQSSSHPVDVEFRGIMAECLEVASAAPLEVLLRGREPEPELMRSPCAGAGTAGPPIDACWFNPARAPRPGESIPPPRSPTSRNSSRPWRTRETSELQPPDTGMSRL